MFKTPLPPSMVVPFFRDAPKPSKPFHSKSTVNTHFNGSSKIMHDDYWNLLYSGAKNNNHDNELCTRLADTIWRANENYKREYKLLFEKNTQFLKKAPQQMITKMVTKKCAGFNVNGLQCGYKATCGTFCKRHAQAQVNSIPDILKEDSDSESESEEDNFQELEPELDFSDGEEDFYD
jgi:hypothetical protein